MGPMDKDSPTPPTIEPHKDGGGVLDGATMWIALDDADVKNGCMWYTPGSHLEAIDPDAPPNFGTLPEGRTGGVPAEAKAGDVIVHSARTIHFSNQVTEMRRRRALTSSTGASSPRITQLCSKLKRRVREGRRDQH